MTEKELHAQICTYIKLQYPKIIFNTDLSGIKLTMGQAIQLKKLRSSNGFPDIQILQPNDNFHGLFLEVKKESPYQKKNGHLKTDAHLIEQNEMHIKLKERGYASLFVWTFEMAKQIIDQYLK